ncbi:hypothetical protein TFLX_05147 [Thermoflexales bacterium]|nr:hypothetical protein TFLX_05147 [Thermoflexales bacterium]
MRQKWEHEDEYTQLRAALRKAKLEGKALSQDLEMRLQELDERLWQEMVAGLPELAPYRTIFEAFEKTTIRLSVPFPDIVSGNFKIGGDDKFFCNLSDGIRSIQIFPLESRHYYDIEIYDEGVCYKGQTSSLEEATIVLSRWLVERCAIEELHRQFPWMADQPFKLSGPRMTLE